ncbi:MAG TPA: MarR family transcriptional regulator [Nocardioidaceae bacterium]|nr:MarR family transcriptional regulator [Nocardioidaceae bacterium]
MGEREKHVAALDQVLELAVLVNEDMTQSLAKIGLTPSRTHLLWEVFHRGSSTQRVLAEALKVSARNVTGLVDGLVESGFVTREPHPTDRRATLVTLTSHGSAVMAEMEAGRQEYAQLLLGDMSTPQLDGFTKGLATVLETLRSQITREVEIHA